MNFSDLNAGGRTWAFVDYQTYGSHLPLVGTYERWTTKTGTPVLTMARSGDNWYYLAGWPGLWSKTGMANAIININVGVITTPGGTGAVTWLTSPPSDIGPGVLEWAVETPFGGGFGFTDVLDLPVVASPGVFTLPYLDSRATDIIKVVSLPPGQMTGSINLTLRSACEVPAP